MGLFLRIAVLTIIVLFFLFTQSPKEPVTNEGLALMGSGLGIMLLFPVKEE